MKWTLEPKRNNFQPGLPFTTFVSVDLSLNLIMFFFLLLNKPATPSIVQYVSYDGNSAYITMPSLQTKALYNDLMTVFIGNNHS